jgi:hypothetical protein
LVKFWQVKLVIVRKPNSRWPPYLEVGSHQKSKGTFSCASPLHPNNIKLISEVFLKLSSGNQIQDGHHIQISGSWIAPEIERNPLVHPLYTPTRLNQFVKFFSSYRLETKFKVATISGYPYVGLHQKSKGTFFCASLSIIPWIYNTARSIFTLFPGIAPGSGLPVLVPPWCADGAAGQEAGSFAYSLTRLTGLLVHGVVWNPKAWVFPIFQLLVKQNSWFV